MLPSVTPGRRAPRRAAWRILALLAAGLPLLPARGVAVAVAGYAPQLQAVGRLDADSCSLGGTGDGNALVEPGERATMTVFVSNLGDQDASNVTVTVSTSSLGVTILTDPPVAQVNLVPRGLSVPATPAIDYQVDPCVPCGQAIVFSFAITSTRTPGRWVSGFNAFVPASCVRCVDTAVGSCCRADGSCAVCPQSSCEASGWVYAGDGTDCSGSPCRSACCVSATCTPDQTRRDCQNAGGDWLLPPQGCEPNPCPGRLRGACCDDQGGCTFGTQASCTGTFVGEGVACGPDNPCTGACCDPAGTCAETTAAACATFYLGDRTSCSPDPCRNACCGADGSCTIAQPADCTGTALAGMACLPDNPCTGACCEQAGACTETTASACGGEYRGDDTSCDPSPCGSGGACCIGTGCTPGLSEADCAAAGGTFEGDGTTCSPNPCLPTGACCQGSTCLADLTAAGCQAQGGVYQGDGTSCQPDPCLPRGACCEGLSCTVGRTEAECTALPGAWQGPGTVCVPNPCRIPGACCNADGSCADGVAQGDCEAGGGVYGGDGVACSANPCPRGACCVGPACSPDRTEAQCLAGAGRWQGAATSCQPDPCVLPGACCAADGTCSTETQDSCLGQGGIPFLPRVDCEQPVKPWALDRNSFRLVASGTCTGTWEVGASWTGSDPTASHNVHRVVGFANRSFIANPYPIVTRWQVGLLQPAPPALLCLDLGPPAASVAYLAVFQASPCSRPDQP